jgi:Flp pilus assembly pilin Flp
MNMGIIRHIQRLGRLEIVRDTRGLSTVEYVIILALIAAFAVGTWQGFGEAINGYLEDADKKIETAMPE